MDRQLTAEEEEEVIALIAQQQNVLRVVIRCMAPRCPDVDDILQETNLVLWRKRHSFEIGTNFNAWAATIARFQVMAWREKSQRNQTLAFDEELMDRLVVSASEGWDNFQARREALQHCLSKLSRESQALIEHRYTHKASLSDFAKQNGRTYAAVCKMLERVRQGLRECINRRFVTERS